jgi:hypothetical protein
MSQQLVQVLFALVGCLIYLTAIYYLSKKQKLTFRYAVGWLFLGVFGVFSAVIIPFTPGIATLLGVSPAAVITLGATTIFLSISIQLSISISGLQHQNQRLAEEIAILSQRQNSDE